MNYFDNFFKNPYFARKVKFKDGDKVCIIMPASDDDLKFLPEGERYNPTVRLFIKTPVDLTQTFEWQNFIYRVVYKANWSTHGFYDYLATRYEGSQTNNGAGFTVT